MKKPMRHIRNWSEYNASLKQRGSLAIWVSSEAVENWTTDELTGKPGAVAPSHNTFLNSDEKADTHRHLDG